jgi:hypothetical protein
MDHELIQTINQIKDQTDQMLQEATIDDPVETRELLHNIEANLPIPVRLNERGVNSLQEQGKYISNNDELLQVEDVMYMGDVAGILCAIEYQMDSDHDKEILITSITHLNVHSSHPLAEEIKRYQKKRTASMAIADIGKRRNKFKPQKKKRGFAH